MRIFVQLRWAHAFAMLMSPFFALAMTTALTLHFAYFTLFAFRTLCMAGTAASMECRHGHAESYDDG